LSAPHLPVLLEPVLELLAPGPGKRIVDATVGGGGHAEEIALRLAGEGELVAIDRDAEMLERAGKRLAPFGSMVRLVHARISHLREVLDGAGLSPVDGILLDLGVCSLQLDDPERGFRFQPAGGAVPLDMRFDRSRGKTAAALLEEFEEAELAGVLREGGVPRPRTLAREIRARLPMETAAELVEAVRAARLPERKHHPATLAFQSLRIAVNEEYRELEAGLDSALDLLRPGGRLAVLTYHSGEDRRVKERLAREARGCICPPDLPVCGCGRLPRIRVLARGKGPSPEEVLRNPRARSARLRGGERS
jgi:16S rRNA (cytosine1402-N4)-methyltransferase